MEPGPEKSDVGPKRQKIKEKTQQQDNANRKKSRRKRRKKRGLACQGEGEQEAMETVSDPAQDLHHETPQTDAEHREEQPEASQPLLRKHSSEPNLGSVGADCQKKAKGVQAHTQTRKCEVRDKETQTAVVVQRTQESQTECVDLPSPGSSKQEHVTENTRQGDQLAQTQPRQRSDKETANHPPNKKPVPDGSTNMPNPNDLDNANATGEHMGKDAGRSGKTSEHSEAQKAGPSKSYANALSGKTVEREKNSNVSVSQTADHGTGTTQNRSPRDRTPVRTPPAVPMFTFHIYAVLDKKFRFNQEHDKLLLHHDNGYCDLEVTHFNGLRQGYLIEARFSVVESNVTRGMGFTYRYVVQQRHKEIEEVARRYIQFPVDTSMKELHLYEGCISRLEAGSMPRWVHSGLTAVGWKKSKAGEISEAWHASSDLLLDRVFRMWSPSEKESTQDLYERLRHFTESFHSVHERVFYIDNSQPPVVKVSELISERLQHILTGEGTSSGYRKRCSPIVLYLSVFTISRRCEIDLGEKCLAKLCHLVSAETEKNKEIMEEISSAFPTPQFTVLGLINHCAQQMVSEVLLLIPLLHKVRQPGADVAKVGPTIEEENWSGLDKIQFSMFREKIKSYSDKRKSMMSLIKDHLPMAEELPLISISWLSLVASDDIPEFSDLTKIAPEHLIQSVLYRLRKFRDMDNIKTDVNVQCTQKLLTHTLLRVEKEKERMVESGNIESPFMSCINVVKATCRIVRLVPHYKTAVLSYQLMLKLVEIVNAGLRKEENENQTSDAQVLNKLQDVQEHFRQWRDGLLSHPLLKTSKTLTYPKEIEMWDALLKVECSLQDVSSQWKSSVERDLTKRISTASEEDQIAICCLESSIVALNKSNEVVQSCFHKLCQSAIKHICQVMWEGMSADQNIHHTKAEKEGDLMHALMRALSSKEKKLPRQVLSSIIVESAERFKNNSVVQLLNPQSAIHYLLSQDWKAMQVDDAAQQVVQTCETTMASLVETLFHGDVPMGQLKAILKYKEQFKKLYRQYKNKSMLEALPVDAEGILTQRDRDQKYFLQQRQCMETLIKMVAKVTESISVPEISTLQEKNKQDLQSVNLNKLMLVQHQKSSERGPGTVLWYDTTPEVLKMAREMHFYHQSNLILGSWEKGAARVASMEQPSTEPVPVTLSQVNDTIWQPLLKDYNKLIKCIASANITFEQLDQALVDTGDQGNGALMKKELNLMFEVSLQWRLGFEPNWVDLRLSQIQEYRQLHEAAGAASAVLQIADKMKLAGDFSAIQSLTQLEEDTFKQRFLGSLTDELLSAKKQLSTVTLQQTACLDEFLESQSLVKWVKENLKNMSDVKVFVDLASISAGENDTEIDQVACFHDAVMGYGPMLYHLSPRAGFDEFMTCAKQVWETQRRDDKLPDKLRDSTRLLGWLKGLKETHGSVEQSSLSLASSINSMGVYHIGWPRENTDKRCLQSLLLVKVKKDCDEKSYMLEDLLELQNKLMLMSSKGEHGKEQVNRFTQVFEGVQRLATILLQMQSSGNMLFQEWKAQVLCCQNQQPCIQATFLSLSGKVIKYYGDVMEQLQHLSHSMELCHKEWCSFMSERRSQFHTLNYYTSEQLVYLCHWIYNLCQRQASAPQQLWHLLSPIKPQCTLADVRVAFANATGITSKPESQSDSSEDDELDLDDEDDYSIMELTSACHGQHGEDSLEDESDATIENDLVGSSSVHDDAREVDAEDSVENLWRRFKDNMPQYLNQHLDISTLAHFLSHLSDMSQQHVARRLPTALQEGKPNLFLCATTEVFTTTLSFYMDSPEQPLPSTDEVLVCKDDTTEEEVEIFLRRALGRDSKGNQQRIYSVINPGLLGYDVSVALGEFFERFERSAGPQYRFVIVSPAVHQHKYVPSFFSNHKVQAGVSITAETAKKYLHHHLTIRNQYNPVSRISPEKLSVWVVSSSRPAVGKSLYVDRLFEKFKQESTLANLIRIRLIEPYVDVDSFIQTLSDRLTLLREQDPVLLHIDTAAVNSGLEELLFHLVVLGCLSDSKGRLWRRNVAHLFTIEVLRPQITFGKQSKVTLELLEILPTIHCRTPREVKQLTVDNQHNKLARTTSDPLMDEQEFFSEGIQRPYQFLKAFNSNQNLDPFRYREGSRVGNPIDCLHHFLSNCGMQDPSWAELKNFSWFLNVQLKDCENSVFCDPDFLADHLPGFKDFIVNFMILMARDFASPSMHASDQSPLLHFNYIPEDDLLSCLTIRKHWEGESHPYIFFNADRNSMSFLGFKVRHRGNTLDAVDPHCSKVLIGNVMTPKLFEGLQRQNIPLTEDFDQLSRQDKIKRISCVVGAKLGMIKGFDPDKTYELTADNVMKMLAIHMRFRCGIPVIIMGETGCGKTRLVRFLCDLQREGREVENMKLVKVHGGTTAEMIYRKVREAEVLAVTNRRKHNLDTILFFDEANTTEAIFAIKEVLCDRTVQGCSLKTDSGLKIIAACNPYRKHSMEMVERLEHAGLGYRVKAEQTKDRLGKVPLRQLVYRVHPLPPSMASLVWDFGQLSDSTELSYIKQIVQKEVDNNDLPVICESIISDVLAASQKYMRSRKNECSFVSLRDVERSMKVLVWFYRHSSDLFPNFNDLSQFQMTLKCLALAVGVCYYPSLVSKEEYLSEICRYFPDPFHSAEALQEEISSCQDLFLQNIETRETIAKNAALRENVFLMVVCIELRIPLFLVGKPGSSKSLAKTVVADAMQGQNSHTDIFKKLKQVHMVSFQCSPHSSPEGIIGTFRNCARFQKDKNMDEYVSVVVLDEIGLAEDSPQMPLKTLHPLLEDGCIDNDKPDAHMKVGFVGISNWALDPAKMNRGIFVSRWDPSEKELVETAKGICSSSNQILLKIKHLFLPLSKAFLCICDKTGNTQFFGLRDYYSLVKMIFATVKSSQEEPDDKQLVEAILRNFSGQPEDFDPVIFFKEVLQNHTEISRPSTLQMIEMNVDRNSNQENRYLLLLTTNNAALYILQQHIFSKGDHPPPEIVFGSGFPKDQEYAQICRNVNRVKTCMETGRTVILLNMQNLYESLYDALNQYYVYLSKQQYVDLGLGSHRVKCRVHKEFRLVVVEDQKKVYELFPVPLINRLEKHRLDRSTDLTKGQCRVLEKLKKWVKEFSGEASEDFKPADIFVGFHSDACASALLQALDKRAENFEDNTVQPQIKEKDVQLETEANQTVASTNKDALADDQVVDAMDVETAGNEQNSMSEENIDDVSNDKVGVDDIPDEDNEKMETEISAVSVGKTEEEVFESAKCFLLNCATPDSVLRLKYSDLTNQEKIRLQSMYFRQQHHQSLRDFLENQLNNSPQCSKFLEVTTFSSLLTRSDLKVLAQALDLHTDRILLLSLHQFDTEVSFCSKLRSFLQDTGPSLGILLVQMDLEESHCSDELIASAKYCTMNYLMSLDNQTCYVVFIVKLSRIPSRSQYIGFQGGVWQSVHIDDLRDTEDMSLNLSVFCGTLISRLLHPTLSDEQMESDEKRKDEEGHVERAHLHSLSLVTSCIQKAVSLLRDPDGVASRSMQRVHVLLTFLGKGQGHVGARFQEVLLGRLAGALAQREDIMPSPDEWVNREAKKRQALQEGGTLRHTLWRCLQSMLTPLLAAMLEVLDRYANLDLLLGAGLSQGLLELWVDILADTQILELTPPQNASGLDQEVLVQHVLMLDGDGHPCSSAAPFSWLFIEHLQSLWEESEFMPVTKKDNTQRILQFVSTFDSSRLGGRFQKLSEEERLDYGHRFLHDFLLVFLKIRTKEELRVFTKAMLGCISELQRQINTTPDISPAWIMAAAKHYAPRLHTLSHILLLQPQLAVDVFQRESKKNSTDLVEDILALGICVERTKLLTVTSLEECESFVRKVEFFQPCMHRAFGQKYSAICSSGCLQQLDSIRSIWNGILVVAAFIQQVLFEVKHRDSRLKELSLKHCNLLQNLMQESPDLRNVDTLEQLIRILNSFSEECIHRDLRFGLVCPVCLSEFKEPSVLPCQHIVCMSCLQKCMADRQLCPKCRTDLPNNFQPTVSQSITAALKQQAEIRACCNSFFLEVVSRFCLSEGERPSEDAVELLFSLLISAHGDVYRTRELTPFLECVDNSPVVRSVLPKLLLQYSFDQVKGHIQKYLRKLEENILKREDRTELYCLFVNCFQDALFASQVRDGEHVSEQCWLQDDAKFLSRVARKQTPGRHEDPAEFLLSMARLRLDLATAARVLQKSITQGEVQADGYLQQVMAVCDYSGNDWYRVYLLRALHRQAGRDSVLALMNSSQWKCLFPPEVLRRQRMISTEVDPFLCCGPSYRVLRDCVAQVLLERRAGALTTELQKLKGSKAAIHVLLALALFRQVTCRLGSPDISLRPSAQETKMLADFLKGVVSGEFQVFCTALLSNRIGGPGCTFAITQRLSAQRRTLLELLVHVNSVLLTGSSVLIPLYQVAFQPQNVTYSFLPTMPEDHTSEAQLWLREGRKKLMMYHCANGHPVFVGECGKPVVISKCICGAQIGGVNHQPVEGFQHAPSVRDQSRTGHILGDASRRSEAPERQMTSAQTCILRLFTHLAMLQGAVSNNEGVSAMIHPTTRDVLGFLWTHLERDMDVLGRTLDQNMDDSAVMVHLMLQTCMVSTAGSPRARPDLSSKSGREQWEKLVCDSVINPVLECLSQRLGEAQDRISADDSLAGSPILQLLHADPGPMLSVPTQCPTHHNSFWSLPRTVTVESFSQLVGQAQGQTLFPLLDLFLKKIQCVRQLHHLPEMAALQSDLLRVFPLASDSKAQTIGQMLQRMPAGYQKKLLNERVMRFIEVWNFLRLEVANSYGGVDVQLCEKELTKDSSGGFLTPSRHGPGSCLQTLVDFLSETHNSLVREAQKLSQQEDSDYIVPLEMISETQLTLCNPEREFLPLVVSHCHYTLKTGMETDSRYNLQGIQTQLARRFLAGKPLIQADTSRYLNRHLQDFSVVLTEVRDKIPQEALKGSVSGAIRAALCSYADVCDAVFFAEIGLRFLGKTGGEPQDPLLSYLTDSLKIGPQIPSSVAKALGESMLKHSIFTWQLLTSWKSELMLNRNQDPFQRLPPVFQQQLSDQDKQGLNMFLTVTDVDMFTLELHEILLLKTNRSTPDQGYNPHWDIRSTMENHLVQKDVPSPPGFDSFPENITLDKAADVWKKAVEFRGR